jgi:hypothetical protein
MEEQVVFENRVLRGIFGPKTEEVAGGWRQPHNQVKVKVKVKLSLCLTKHHSMKAYWGSGDIAPRIL